MKHYIDKITKQMFGYEQNPNDTNLRELTDEEFECWKNGTLNSYNEELDIFEFIDKRDFETEKLNKYEYLKDKIDLPSANPEEVTDEIVNLLGCKPEDVLRVSGKTGAGVS